MNSTNRAPATRWYVDCELEFSSVKHKYTNLTVRLPFHPPVGQRRAKTSAWNETSHRMQRKTTTFVCHSFQLSPLFLDFFFFIKLAIRSRVPAASGDRSDRLGKFYRPEKNGDGSSEILYMIWWFLSHGQCKTEIWKWLNDNSWGGMARDVLTEFFSHLKKKRHIFFIFQNVGDSFVILFLYFYCVKK